MKKNFWTNTLTIRLGRYGAPMRSEILYLALIAVIAFGIFLTTVISAENSRWHTPSEKMVRRLQRVKS